MQVVDGFVAHVLNVAAVSRSDHRPSDVLDRVRRTGAALRSTPLPMTNELSFEPLTRETVSAQIRAQLLRRITVGELERGTRLPSERDLADQFQVARTSVREALQGLVSLGIVERRGNRSYVAEHLPEVTMADRDVDKRFVAELFETRRVLEVPIAELAAARATPAQRAAVRDVADQFDHEMPLEEFRNLDRQLHTLIAAACANPLLIELYGKVLDRLFRSETFDSLLSSELNRAEVRAIVADSVDAHRRIAAALDTGDPAAMRDASLEHLDAVERQMVDDLV